MAFQQQLETFVRSITLSVIKECKEADLMVSGAEEYLMKDDFIIKKLLSVTELSVHSVPPSASQGVKEVKKKRITKKERNGDKPTRVASSTQLLKGKLMKRIKAEFAHLVDTTIEIPNSKGTGKVNFHQCTMGTAEYASRVVLNSSSTEEEAIVVGMIEFNKKHQVTYYKVTEATVLTSTVTSSEEEPEITAPAATEEEPEITAPAANEEEPEITAPTAATEEEPEAENDDDSDDDSDDDDDDDSDDDDSDNDDEDISLGTNKFGFDFD